MSPGERQEVVVPVGHVTKDDAAHLGGGERPHLHLGGVVRPLRVTGDKNWIRDCREIVYEMLLEIRRTVFFADDPRVHMRDGVVPRAERHAAVREVVIFLDGAVELPDRMSERSRGKRGKSVLEEQVAA